MKSAHPPSGKRSSADITAPAPPVSSGRWATAVPQGAPSGLAPHSESKLAVRPGARAPSKIHERVRIALGEAPVEPALVSVTSRPHDDVLEYTHTFVVAYARHRFRNTLVASLSVATYELLGNALNYGSVLADVVFQLVESPSIAVRVSNETVPVRIDMLRSHLERVSKDPEAAFLEEMRRSMSGGTSKPMLGLARIVHEAKLSLELYVAGTRLTMIARFPT